jgi:hypothetical protein
MYCSVRKVLVPEVNPETRFDCCPIHCEATVARIYPHILRSMINEDITIVNFFKFKSLSSWLSSVCQELDSEHMSLLLLVEVQRLLSRKILMCSLSLWSAARSLLPQGNRYSQLLAVTCGQLSWHTCHIFSLLKWTEQKNPWQDWKCWEMYGHNSRISR